MAPTGDVPAKWMQLFLLECATQRFQGRWNVIQAHVKGADAVDPPGLLRLAAERRERTGERGQQEAAAIHAGTIGRAPAVVNARGGWCTLPACRGRRQPERRP